jgi:hypothetical protein
VWSIYREKIYQHEMDLVADGAMQGVPMDILLAARSAMCEHERVAMARFQNNDIHSTHHYLHHM